MTNPRPDTPKPVLTEAKDLALVEDGTVLDAVIGLVEWTGPRENRTRQDGTQYVYQPFRISGVQAEIFDHPDIAPYVDQVMVFASYRSRNGRYGGVKVKTRWSGMRMNKIMSVSKAGVIHRKEGWEYLCGQKT